jgi:AcrR family transcriptional regulator
VSDTKRKLLDATVETLRDHGIAGTSARAIATAAGVNQALVFYHFGTVAELVDAACRDATETRVAMYREKFLQVNDLGELLSLGRSLHDAERAAGNVRMLAQVLAGAQQDESLAGAARHAMALWTVEIEATLRRVLAGSVLEEIADPVGLAHSVSAAFIGIELYEGVDAAGAELSWSALEQLSVIVDVVPDLGPVARRALRNRIRRSR